MAFGLLFIRITYIKTKAMPSNVVAIMIHAGNLTQSGGCLRDE
jgi:hypothetical protein